MPVSQNPEDLFDKTDAQLTEWLTRLNDHLVHYERRLKSKDISPQLHEHVAHMTFTAKTIRKELERRGTE